MEKLVRKITDVVLDTIAPPHEYIGEEDMHLFRQAHITSPSELRWIAQVKKATKKAREGDISPYGLIRLHAMAQKDLVVLGPYMMSKQTERYLERFYRHIGKFFTFQFNNRTPEEVEALRQKLRGETQNHASVPSFEEERMRSYEDRLLKLYKEYSTASTSQEQFSVLTKFLNLFHAGGNPEGLHTFGTGYPKQKFDSRYGSKSLFEVEITNSARDFLQVLNNLGHQNTTEKQ